MMKQELTALQAATIALRAYQCRHDHRPRCKTGRRSGQLVSQRAEMVAMARRYIRLARQKGWRGSVLAAWGVA